MNIRGWVYVISNPAMPGLVKVGFSRKDPQLRADELSGTGCPQPYQVEYDVLVIAPQEVEQAIHQRLIGKRDGKEWFRCSLSEAIAAITAVSEGRLAQGVYRRVEDVQTALKNTDQISTAKASNAVAAMPAYVRGNRAARGHLKKGIF